MIVPFNRDRELYEGSGAFSSILQVLMITNKLNNMEKDDLREKPVVLIKHPYYLSTDIHSYQLLKSRIVKDGKEKGQEKLTAIGYSVKINGIINLTIEYLVHDGIEQGELKTLKEIRDYFEKSKKEITEYLLSPSVFPIADKVDKPNKPRN